MKLDRSEHEVSVGERKRRDPHLARLAYKAGTWQIESPVEYDEQTSNGT